MEGKGKLFFLTYEYYIGEFKEDKMHGKGKLYNKKGDVIYEGFFADNKKEGKGKLFLENKCVYEGEFLNNFKHAKGYHII